MSIRSEDYFTLLGSAESMTSNSKHETSEFNYIALGPINIKQLGQRYLNHTA